MAIFTRQEEIPIQAKRRQYKGTKGFRKTMMNAMTSKFNPLAYTGLTHIGAEAFAQGDDKDVLKQNRGAAAGQLVKAGKLATNFVPGGALAKIGMGIGADTASGAIDNANKSSRRERAVEDAVDTTEDFEKSGLPVDAGTAALGGSALIDSINKEDAMSAASDSLDDAVADMDADEILKTTDALPDEAAYTTAMDAGGKTGKKGLLGIGKGGKLGAGINKFQTGKFAKGLGAAAGVASIAGDTAALIQGQAAYRKGIETDKKRLMQKKLPNSHYSYA